MASLKTVNLLLLLFSHLYSPIHGDSSCPVDPAHCSCFPNDASFALWCPRTSGHLFKITLKPRILEISCNTNKDTSFEDLLKEFSKLDLSSHGEVDKLYYEHCRIPHETSFSALTSALNISSVKELNLYWNTFYPDKGFRVAQFANTSKDLERIEINAPSRDGKGSSTLYTPGMFDGVEDQLKFVSLSTNTAKELPSSLLKSLRSLNKLRIREKDLTHLPSELLKDLVSLERFYLRSSALSTIPDYLFAGNHSALEYIKLEISNLTSRTPNSIFKDLSGLKHLEISGNFLVMSSPGMFTQNPKLETIKWVILIPCRRCEAKEMRVPSFTKGSASLKSLSIKWRGGYELLIGDDFLEGCSNLESLSIRQTGLSRLPDGLFQTPYRKLESLDLSDNALKSLQNSVFRGLTDLKDLNLKSNAIQGIGNRVFRDLIFLESLDLSNNALADIPSLTFHYNSRLQILSLRGNRLREEPNWESLSHLKKLDLSHNDINFTEFNIQLRVVLLSLEEINFSHNAIGPKLNRNYLRFHQNNLKLNLRGNQIRELDPFPPHPNQNISVLLGGNPLTCDCEALQFHSWLIQGTQKNISLPDRLYCASPSKLEGSIFRDVPGDQLSCHFPSTRLPRFSCPCGECSYIPFTQTLVLNCSNSGQSSLPLKAPPSIRGSQWLVLDMTHNQLQGPLSIPESYADNLTHLFASWNALTSLPKDNPLPKNLEVLHVDHNRMRLLSSNEEVMPRVLKELSIAGNDFPCNCDSESLFRLVKTSALNVLDASEVRLRNCSNAGDILLSDFGDEDEFCQQLSTLVVLYALPAIAVLLLALTFVIVSLIYKERIIVILYQYPIFRQYFIYSDESKNPYDVFISYSHEDQEFVEGRLVNGLESPLDDPLLKYKCLLAVRDFVPGEVISEQIVRAVDSSSRTIIVLSEGFLHSEWAQYEFEIAHSRRKVIVLKIGQLPEKEKLGPALNNYIAQNTYLEIEHPNFWRNLRYALPHKGNSKQWRPTWLKPRKTPETMKLKDKPYHVPHSNTNSLPV